MNGDKQRALRVVRHQMIIDFAAWTDQTLPKLIGNVVAITQTNVAGLANNFLQFCVERAIVSTTDNLVFACVDAWELLDKESMRQTKRTALKKDQDYLDVLKIRNKMLGHRIEALIEEPEVRSEWFARTYGSHVAVCRLCERVAIRLRNQIKVMFDCGQVQGAWPLLDEVPAISSLDIVKVLDAMKAAGCYACDTWMFDPAPKQ
jgi:hypothetical protein